MARREVIEVQCDRCGKVETQELGASPKGGTTAELTVLFHSQEVIYDDLCTRCRSACEGYFKSMTKQVERAVEEKEKAPQATPPRPGLLGLGGKR